jgi:ABC-type branched-subunit amino acid transport system ATPase component
VAEALLTARDVCVTIDGVEILRGADLDLKAGELVAIVGNGAGKSTLVRAVSGLHRPTAGTVSWSGHSLAKMRGRELAKVAPSCPNGCRCRPGSACAKR